MTCVHSAVLMVGVSGSVVGCHAHALSLPVDMQGFDKGTQSKGQAKTRFRKAPKTENVYIKLLVKVS